MSSGYPGTLDTLPTNRTDATDEVTGTPTTGGAGDHAQNHNNTNDAVNKIESTLGTNPQGSFATVAAIIAAFGLRTFYPETYGATADGKEVNDGAINVATSATTLTSATAGFTAGDVGKRVTIAGAGAAGAALRTTIAGFTNSTTVTITASASTTVSSANVVWGTDNTSTLQACADAALAVPGARIKYGVGTYLVESAPRTDRNGNCIISLYTSQDAPHVLLMEGVAMSAATDDAYKNLPLRASTVIRTTRIEDSYTSPVESTTSAILNASDTQVTLTNATSFATSGAIVMWGGAAGETITYTGKSGNNLTGITRNVNGTGIVGGSRAAGQIVQQVQAGPPSVIGAATTEAGFSSNHWWGPAFAMRNITVQVPLNPRIAGIDSITMDGQELIDVSVVAGKSGDAASFPTNTWAFGFRHPNRWCNNINKSSRCFAVQMYCGHCYLHEDHHTLEQAGTWRCYTDFGFSKLGDGLYPVIMEYAMSEQSAYYISGYEPGDGVASLARVAYIYGLLQTERGNGAFAPTNWLNDPNNFLRGNLTIHDFSGLGVSASVTVTGAQKLRLSLGDYTTIQTVASAGTITVPAYADRVKVSGTTSIDYITASYATREITLIFTGAAGINHNTASPPAGTASILLNGNTSKTGLAGRVVKLIYDGTNWQEVPRIPQGYTLSNVTPDRIFDPTNYSMDELAQVLATVIRDLGLG